MSETTALTKKQEEFLRDHVHRGFFKSKKKKQENVETRTAYIAFVKAKALLKAEALDVPAEYAPGLDASRKDAKEAKEDGDFVNALAKITAVRTAITEAKAAVAQRKDPLKQAADGFAVPAWVKDPLKSAVQAEHDKAKQALLPPMPLPTALDAATAAMKACVDLLAPAKALHDRRDALKAEAIALADPAAATAKEKAGMKAARDAVVAALPDDPPDAAAVEKAERALDLLRRQVDRVQKFDALAKARPAAGAAAKDALAAHTAVLDDANIGEVTPEIVADTTAAAKAAQVTLDTRTKELKTAQAAATPASLKSLQDADKKARQDAVKTAQAGVNAAKAEFDGKEKVRKAAFGQDALTKAVSHGPLSAESGRPFSEATATNLLKAFKDEPEVAAAATKVATSAAYPDEVGARVGWAVEKVKAGFKPAASTRTFPPEFSRTYAERLLNGCGTNGPEYGAGLDAYVASGDQFEKDPLQEKATKYYEAKGQVRARALAGAVMDPATGHIDLDTPKARKTVGHALYNPECTRCPLPGFTGSLMQTMAQMKDPATRGKAEAVLAGAGAPQAGAATDLVQRTLGKAGTDVVGAGDTRLAVMTAMMSPVRQGQVGSCFATGPVVRQRAMEPVDAMASMAAIAETGTFKSADGLTTAPAVTKLPANGNPLTRSLEYSVATAMAQASNSAEKTRLDKVMQGGVDQIATKAGGSKVRKNKKKLRAAVSAAFTIQYDPTLPTPVAADGSSSMGRFVMVRVSDGKEIKTEADFKAAVADIAVATLKPAKATAEATIRTAADSPAFIGAVSSDKYKPWEMPGGGPLAAPYKVVYGTATETRMLPKPPKTGPQPAEGERTASVLAAMAQAFNGNTNPMETISTDSHVFNALPGTPGMKALAKDGKYAENVKATLVDPGKVIAATDLSADRAAWLFGQEMEQAAAAEEDATLKAMITAAAKAAPRPAAPMKPAALAQAVQDALAPYNEAAALARTAAWVAEKTAGGTAPDTAAIAKETDEQREKAREASLGGLTNLLFQDIKVPEVVIADTNWGGPSSETKFVIAPDPVTGELLLWSRMVPPGRVQRAKRDWIDSDWDVVRK